MKHLLLTTIAAVVLVGCGPSGLLHEALREGNIEAVKQAIADGVDVNAKDDYGVTPMYRAAYIGHKEIANLLISKGADVNAKNDDGWTPLHQASAGGHKEVAELLIGKGADVNAKADDGRTPLHSAAYWGRKEVAALLIGKGADVNTKIEVGEYKGQTPLDIATLPNNPNKTETADLLRKHGGKSGAEDSIHIASQMGNIKAVKQHLVDGVDVNAKNRYGSTPLHYAAMEGHKEIVELLISKGADVDAKSNRGTTPLLAASPRPSPGRAPFGGHKEIVEILIANGADVNAKDRDGMTPLFMAAIVGQSAALMGQSAESALCKEIADLLRTHGGKTGAELKAEGK